MANFDAFGRLPEIATAKPRSPQHGCGRCVEFFFRGLRGGLRESLVPGSQIWPFRRGTQMWCRLVLEAILLGVVGKSEKRKALGFWGTLRRTPRNRETLVEAFFGLREDDGLPLPAVEQIVQGRVIVQRVALTQGNHGNRTDPTFWLPLGCKKADHLFVSASHLGQRGCLSNETG